MKNIIIIIFLLLFSNSTFSQIKNNYTEIEILEDYEGVKPEYGTTPSGEKYIYYIFDTANSSVVYYFDNKNVCNRTRIIPGNDTVLKVLIEYCNENYVVISDKKWKWYSEEGVYDVELNLVQRSYLIDYVLE